MSNRVGLPAICLLFLLLSFLSFFSFSVHPLSSDMSFFRQEEEEGEQQRPLVWRKGLNQRGLWFGRPRRWPPKPKGVRGRQRKYTLGCYQH